MLLSFSGAYLLGICFLHLIPEIYSSAGFKIGLFVLFGFLIQLILEFLSNGMEHGHVHAHGHNHVFPIVAFASLCLHAFLEGMPIENELHSHVNESQSNDHPLLMGVLFHKVPISIALMTMMLASGVKKSNAILYLLFFALMAPLGAMTNHFLGTGLVDQFPYYFTAILALVVGMLLHISTTILFESSEGHSFNVVKFVSIITGGVVAYLTVI